MDIRLKSNNKQQISNNSLTGIKTRQKDLHDSVNSLDQINDALLFNIMKKIQCRQKLIEDYKKQKESQNKNYITKYVLHSNIPVYYLFALFIAKAYKFTITQRPTLGMIITMPNIIFHCCLMISLNEYFKYQNIFKHEKETADEYKVHQRNVDKLMKVKMKQFSLFARIIDSNKFMSQDKLINIFKYRIVI